METMLKTAGLPRMSAEVLEQTIALNPYIPHIPWPKQMAFLELECLDALIGGAASGGKSDALLMAALQFVTVPGYAALIVRRHFADLKLPGGLIDRSIDWLRPHSKTGAAKWNAQEHKWVFKSGAVLQFGYADREGDEKRYDGSELQFTGLDEACHFTERQIVYFYERLRRKGSIPVPLRMRLGTTPGGPGHCVPHGSVLTPEGWKDIRDFRVGDAVYAVSRDGSLFPATVEQVHRSHYRGEMVRVEARGLRMACTPNHRVGRVVRNRSGGEPHIAFAPLDESPGQTVVARAVKWVGERIERFTLPPRLPGRARKLQQPESLPGDLYAEFMGWYLSEGCVIDRFKSFDIAQSKPDGRVLVHSLLDRCGFKFFKLLKQSFRVCAQDWWRYLRQFGKCRDKFVPAEIKNAPPEQLQLFFDALMAGDGHRHVPGGEGGTYYTISKRLCDDVAEIAVKLGSLVSVHTRQRKNRVGLSYEVSVKRVRGGGTEVLTGQHVLNVKTQCKRKSKVWREPFDGEVYCIGVPEHHSFLVMQEGSVWVSGNSFIHRRYVSPGTPGKAFIPATVDDNPAVDATQYRLSLEEIRLSNPLRYRQMLLGDWEAVAGGRFEEKWLRNSWEPVRGAPGWVVLRGAVPFPDGEEGEVERFDAGVASTFQTYDPSASASKDADHFVVSTWKVTPKANLVWWGCHRAKAEFNPQLMAVKSLYREHRPQFIAVEELLNQRGQAQELRRSTNPVMVVRSVNPKGRKKLDRALGAIALAGSGRLFLPRAHALFPLDEVRGELIRFTGTDDDSDDVVDSASYATEMLPFVRPGGPGSARTAPFNYVPQGLRQYGVVR